jgi:peptidoglycan/xylan/chitin deacetylase (PgdA/CDA1 family)
MSIRKYFDRTYGIVGLTVFVLSTLIATLGSPALAHADAVTTALTPASRISFTFDDSLQSTYTSAEPILAQYGLTGTDYAITGCVGMITVPNTCNANQDTPYMSWAQLQALQADGWEIGSHTVDHVCLASSGQTDPSDCANPTPLTTAQVDAELANSQSALASNGINATDFAPPYGDYNNNVLAQIAKYYASMRNFNNVAGNTNVWPNSDYYLQDMTVLEKTDTVATVEAAINNAISTNTWLVLTFHDIESKPSKNPDDFQYGTTELQQIAAYVQTKEAANQIQSVHINQGLVSSNQNMLPNGNFSNGISDGWSTDAPATITADNQDNGSYPNPTNSIALTSTSSTTHLFSPKVAVTSGQTYIFKNFLNLAQTSGGEVGFYIDEYNGNGQWVSGRWVTAENNPFVEDMNFAYTPSSSNVAFASLQVVVTGTPGTLAYLANSQMFPQSAPVSTPPTNLLANSNFNDGIGDGWSTDSSSQIYADANNNGSPSDAQYSIDLNSKSNSSNGHLFSPIIQVSSADTYTLGAWLNINQINTASGGEVAFYVDEYNSSGQWISGQYKLGVHSLGVNNVAFNYTPSSSNVTGASLQVIVVGGANIQAYLDDAIWNL